MGKQMGGSRFGPSAEAEGESSWDHQWVESPAWMPSVVLCDLRPQSLSLLNVSGKTWVSLTLGSHLAVLRCYF